MTVSLSEGVPQRWAEMLAAGELDLAIMAAPDGFAERFQVKPLYRERFVVAFPPGHRFEGQETVRTADCGGESYLMRMNCEYGSYWDDFLEEQAIELKEVYRSEREDWIQSMVMAGAGICFLPEYSPSLPGPHHAPPGGARGPSRDRCSSPCPAGASRRRWRPSSRP